MLSENVLEELTRATGLREHLVTLAWPNLSTESRLQLIAAMEGPAVSKQTPTWLAKIALDDPAPIVRYWAARHTYFQNKGPEYYFGEGFKALAATDDDKALHAKATADPCQFVRFCVEKSDEYNYKTLNAAPQLARLAFIRHLSRPSFQSFVTWLGEAIAAGIPDAELRDCANEFFMHPRVASDLKRDTSDFWDGYDAYQCGDGMKKGWALTKIAGPRLRGVLSFALPTSYGLGTMTVEDLAQLPDEVLETFLYRLDPSKEIEAVLKLMNDQPQRFSPQIIEKFRKQAENFDGPNPSAQELQEDRSRQAVERQAETLETVLDVKHGISDLLEYVQQAVTKLTTETQAGFKALGWGVAGIGILLLLLRWKG